MKDEPLQAKPDNQVAPVIDTGSLNVPVAKTAVNGNQVVKGIYASSPQLSQIERDQLKQNNRHARIQRFMTSLIALSVVAVLIGGLVWLRSLGAPGTTPADSIIANTNLSLEAGTGRGNTTSQTPVTSQLAINGDLAVNGVLSLSPQAISNLSDSLSTKVDIQSSYPNKVQAGNINISGIMGARSFSGDGALLNNLNASQINLGTLADTRLSDTVTKLGQTIPLSALQSPVITSLSGLTGGGNIDFEAGTGIVLLANQASKKITITSTNSGGDITSVIAGNGLTGGGTSGDVTLNLDSTVTIQGNTFNGANQLVQLDNTGALPALDGSNISALNASSLTSGTLSNSRLSATVTTLGNSVNGSSQLVQTTAAGLFPALNGSLITSLNASNILTGALSDSRLSANVTLKGNAFNSANNLVLLDGSGTLPALSAANLTNINASEISSGALADSRLSGNVTIQGNTFNGNSQLVQLTAGGALPALNGSALNNLSAGNIAAGGTLPSLNGSALTTLNGSNITSGTVADARLSANVTLQGNTFNGASQLVQLTAGGLLPTLSGANLTALNGSNISSGTVANARLSTDVTLQGNTFNGANNLVLLDGTGALPVLSAVNLTNINASEITSGALADNRLSANVTLQGNTFNGANKLIQLNGAGAIPTLSGANLTNLSASAISSGSLSDGRLSANVSLLNATQTFTGPVTFTQPLSVNTIQPSASMTIGSASHTLLMQGDITSQFTATQGGNTVAVGFSGTPIGSVAYNFDAATSAGSYTICTTVGNCASSGGGVTTLGGTTNKLARYTGSQSIGDSSISDTGSAVTVAGSGLFKAGADSTTALRVQNAAGSTNVFTVDTTNTRVAIGSGAANYPLDVTGDINSSSGLRVAGNLVCDSTGCASASGSGFYVQNGTALQTGANLNIESASTTSPTASFKSKSGQTADIIQAKNSSGTVIAKVDTNGNLDIAGQYRIGGSQLSSSNLSDSSSLAKLSSSQTFTGANLFQNAVDSSSAFVVQNAAGTSNLLVADTTNSRLGVGTANPGYTVDVNGDVNISTGSSYRINGVAICGVSGTCAPSAGSSNYIQNSTSLQTAANFSIQSTSANSVAGVLRGASGQTANIFEVQTNSPATVFAVGATGQVLAKNSTNSTTAFQIQNASATPVLVADTTNGRVAIGQASASYALDVNGDINASSALKVGGNTVCTSSGCSAASGSTSYIQNGTSLQVANFDIQSAGASSVGAVVRGAASQSADLFQAQDANGNTLSKIDKDGNVTATAFSGTGSALTSLNGTNISSGTVADARLSTNVTLQGNTFNGASQLVQLTAGGILPTLSGANLTSLSAANITSGGTLPALNGSALTSLSAANITSGGTLPALNGSALTSLNGTNISSGTVADARLSTNVTLQGNTFNGASQLLQLTAGGILPTLSGANLTALNGSNISTGTVADARLSSNVTLQGNTFNGASQLLQLTVAGILPVVDGSSLTSLTGTNISSGTVADARLSTNVALLNGSQTFTGSPLFQNASNSTTAFRIQNASGTSLFAVDTANSALTTAALTAGGLTSTNGFTVSKAGTTTFSVGNSGSGDTTVFAGFYTGSSASAVNGKGFSATQGTLSNLLSNGGIENGTTNWAATTAATLTRITSDYNTGTASLSVATTAVANDGAKIPYALAASTTYSFSVSARATSSSFSTLQLGYSADTTTQTSCLTAQTVLTTGWQRYSCTFTTGTVSGAAASRFVYVKQTDATARTFYIDTIQLETASAATNFSLGSIGLNATVTSPTTFQNASDSTAAVQVQNAAGTSILSVDSINMKVTVKDLAVTGHIISGGTAPTIAANTGAGTSPTISISGTDTAGTITLTTGTSPTVSADVLTVTFATAFSAAPQVVFSAASGSAAALSGNAAVYATPATGTFKLTTGSTGLTASTQYKWTYHVIQ